MCIVCKFKKLLKFTSINSQKREDINNKKM